MDITAWIDENSSLFREINDEIWRYAETRFQETRSAALMMRTLENEGFSVRTNVANLPTAITGCWGSGKPVVAILGEYDALSGMSQKPSLERREALEEGAAGHGCGHNVLGAGSLLGAVAAKRAIEAEGLEGTICFFGCPGEEGGDGKAFLAAAGAFDGVDAALTWHPMDSNMIWGFSSLATLKIIFHFSGISSHAAASPHLGRSALDAVELTNVGANYLREHIPSEARIHYAITNTGGSAPNVVQAEAEVYYYVRAPEAGIIHQIQDRLLDVARGAALMTGTTLKSRILSGSCELIPNRALEEILYQNFSKVGPPAFDKSDEALARRFQPTLGAENSMLQILSKISRENGAMMRKRLAGKVLNDVILPLFPEAAAGFTLPASTDVGDVSWNVPTAQFTTSCWAFGTAAHSWQAVAQGCSSLAHKGLIAAGKILALSAVDLIRNPATVTAARRELETRLAGRSYTTLLPEGAKPEIIGPE